MMFEEYMQGKGLNVSKEQRVRGTIHKYIEPNNLYLLRNDVGIENFDYLYSYGIINKTKYYRILLYEWFLVVKEYGYIIIIFEENELLNHSNLMKEISTLFIYKNNYEVVDEKRIGEKIFVVLRKTKSIKIEDGDINKWTFGLVTNGKRKDFIEHAINSIRELNIPDYEIIICGTYYNKITPDINYINFAEKDDKGWITKKKNLICENAKYENIVVIHDRIYFDKEWFEGIKKWGNYFDVLSCPVILPFGSPVKFSNWETVSKGWKRKDEYKLFHSNARLDPTDWDANVYVGGPIIILKKSVWAEEKWNEELFWGDAEDIEYSHRQHKGGILIRFNPFSKVYSSTTSGIIFNAYYEKNPKKLGNYHNENYFQVVILKCLDFFGFRRNQKLTSNIIKYIKSKNKATDWRMKS